MRVNGLEYMKQIIDAWYDEPLNFQLQEKIQKQFIEAEKMIIYF